jgi:curved DNA-binding protein
MHHRETVESRGAPGIRNTSALWRSAFGEREEWNMATTPPIDYYEFLQISPHADAETIHRVYRFLAARLHPDNKETGHAENFQLLKKAYDVLANPATRAEYDAARGTDSPQPYSATVDFMDALDGEVNRRLAVLAVLYYRRRTTPNFPEVSLAEIEERMGFPRDYLDFTMWYLTKKGYISRADNAQFTLSADGVDYVEAQRASMPILNKLLTSGSGPAAPHVTRTNMDPVVVHTPNAAGNGAHSAGAAKQIVLPSATDRLTDRRLGKPERRLGAPDPRTKKLERRFNLPDRRVNITDRRAPN